MAHKHEWSLAIISALSTSVIFYCTMGVVGYYVYGNYLMAGSSILGVIGDFDPSTHIYIQITMCILVAHLMLAFPIVINPVFIKVAQMFGGGASADPHHHDHHGEEQDRLIDKHSINSSHGSRFIMPVRVYILRLIVGALVMLCALFVSFELQTKKKKRERKRNFNLF